MKEKSQNSVVVTKYSNIRREASRRWTSGEDELFYSLIEKHGTDFSMFCLHFPSRSKKQIKSKFIREAKLRASLISRLIRGRRSNIFESVVLGDEQSQPQEQDEPPSPSSSGRC